MPEAAAVQSGVSHRRLALGLGAFAALALGGLLAAGWLDRGARQLAGAPRAMPAGLLLLAAGLVLLDFLLGGLRLHVWVRRVDPAARYTLSLKAYLVNLAATAVSPLGAASAPAQWAVLVRSGVAGPRAIAALLLNYIGILGALALGAGVGALYLLRAERLGGSLAGPGRTLVVASAVLAALLLVGLVDPRIPKAIAAGLSRLAARSRGWPNRVLARAAAGLERAAADYHAALGVAREGWQASFAASFAISGAMLLNKCAVGFLVALGLGFTGGYPEVAARQLLQALMLYFSPTPGGSGLAEATVPAFMAGVVPEGRWMQYALVWRVLTSYLGIAAGAIAAAAVFGRRKAPAMPALP